MLSPRFLTSRLLYVMSIERILSKLNEGISPYWDILMKTAKLDMVSFLIDPCITYCDRSLSHLKFDYHTGGA